MNFNNYPPIHILIQGLLFYFTLQTFFYHFPSFDYKNLTWHTPLDLFKIHPFSMCLSLMLFYNESVYVFCRIYPLPRKKWLHYGLNIVGFFLSLIGFSAIVYKKFLSGEPHFKSWHGFLGFITIIHTIIQWIGGWLIISPKWDIFDTIFNTKRIRKWWHRASGCLVALEIFTVFVTSCYTTWFQEVSFRFDFYLNITIYMLATLFSIYLVIPRLNQTIDNCFQAIYKMLRQEEQKNTSLAKAAPIIMNGVIHSAEEKKEKMG